MLECNPPISVVGIELQKWIDLHEDDAYDISHCDPKVAIDKDQM